MSVVSDVDHPAPKESLQAEQEAFGTRGWRHRDLDGRASRATAYLMIARYAASRADE